MNDDILSLIKRDPWGVPLWCSATEEQKKPFRTALCEAERDLLQCRVQLKQRPVVGVRALRAKVKMLKQRISDLRHVLGYAPRGPLVYQPERGEC
jgi:hypothetical protein